MNYPTQLTLNLCLKEQTTFGNFVPGANSQLLTILQQLPTKEQIQNFVYIYGQEGAGKTHLLNATCQYYNTRALTATYLACEELITTPENPFENLETLDLICLDNLQMLANHPNRQRELFHCFNRLMALNKKLLVTANTTPQYLGLTLPDLKSRMASGLIFQLQALNEEGKITALQLRATSKGLQLNEIAAEFLLSHYHRNPKELFAALNRLDAAALRAKRKLTIPFIKAILEL